MKRNILIICLIFISITSIYLMFNNKNNAKIDKISNAQLFLSNNKQLLDSVVTYLYGSSIPYLIVRNNAFVKTSVYKFEINDLERFEYNIDDGLEKFLIILNSKINDSINIKTVKPLMENIFKLLNKTKLYLISNQEVLIDFMINPSVESIYYMDKSVKFQPEKSNGVIFKYLNDNYYYYHIPR